MTLLMARGTTPAKLTLRAKGYRDNPVEVRPDMDTALQLTLAPNFVAPQHKQHAKPSHAAALAPRPISPPPTQPPAQPQPQQRKKPNLKDGDVVNPFD
jgi:hypothetical protein